MVRSGAKNWKDVAVLTDASQYQPVIDELKTSGAMSQQTRFALVGRLQPHQQLRRGDQRLPLGAAGGRHALAVPGAGQRPLREAAGPALRREPAPAGRVLPRPVSRARLARRAQQLQGKELSYNNIADADAAWECVKSFDTPACVIVKHANPCGVAIGKDWRPTARPSRPIRPRPSAASSPSTGRWTARRRRRCQAVRRGADGARVLARGAAGVCRQGQRAAAEDRCRRAATGLGQGPEPDGHRASAPGC